MISINSRRRFIKKSTMIFGASTLPNTFPFMLRNRGMKPSDQINIGLIGCRGRGFSVLKQHLKIDGVMCGALCDIDANVLSKRAGEIEKEYNYTPSQYEDFRDLISQKDLDAVIIATPDHWHCLPTVYACQEKKDVYVEKPMANSIAECNVMVNAARKYNRVVQVGQQQRSSEVWKGAIEYLHSGKLGAIHRTNIWANFNYGLGPKKVKNSEPPPGVNYDLFLGPAPQRPFNAARFHGSWRFFWDYGGGLMTDWGVHLLDMALWAKNLERPAEKVIAMGSRLHLRDRSRETHDTLSAVFNYGDYLIQWEHNAGKQIGPYDRLYGVAFIGENGTLVADRSKWEVFPEWDSEKKTGKMEKVGPVEGMNGHSLHAANFIECIKSRTEPACSVEIGRAVAINAHMANIAVRSGSNQLTWDDKKGRFVSNSRANKFIKPGYRKPWKFPIVK